MVKKWHLALGGVGILVILIIVLGTGLLQGDKAISSTYIIPAGTFHPLPITPEEPAEPTSGSGDAAKTPAIISGGTAIAIAFTEDEISNASPAAKESFIRGITSLTQYGRYNESVNYFNDAIAIDRNFSQAWIAKGVALHNMRRYNESLQCFDYALKIDPDDAGIWNLMGVTFKDMGRYEDAAESNRRAAELDPRYGTGMAGIRE
jgi:hypothetical protein